LLLASFHDTAFAAAAVACTGQQWLDSAVGMSSGVGGPPVISIKLLGEVHPPALPGRGFGPGDDVGEAQCPCRRSDPSRQTARILGVRGIVNRNKATANMHKPWLVQYPPGVPAEIDAGRFATLKEMLASCSARYGQLPAYNSMATALTYRQLDEASRAFATWLQKVAGLQRGDRVALMMPNLLQYPVAMFGVLRAGMVVVNVNPLYTPRELVHQLNDAGATAIVVLENFAHTLEQVIASTPVRAVVTTQVGDLLPPLKRLLTNLVVKHVKKLVPPWRLAGAVDFNHVLAAGRAMAFDEVALTRDDLAFLQYTGGTTGVAKGAMLSHGNMVANVLQVAAWTSPNLNDGQETVVIPLPLYHVFALTGCLSFFSKGAQAVLIANPRDMPAFLKALRRTRFTAIIGVNTLFRAMLDTPGFADVDLQPLKLAVAGGMAVQRSVAQRWSQRAGVPLVEGYGLTESAPVAIANPVNIQEWSGQIGVPLPSTEAAMLDDDGVPVAPGQVGEICLRGPQIMQGYWNRPEETAKMFTAGGWMRTGDMGIMDERGSIRITDRKKDMIVVSGFKVFPNEIEDVLTMHPGVLEAGAIGVPDEHSGEAVKVVVVRKDPALTESDLLAHCRQHLTAYKMPRIVEFRSTPLPKTNIGKILRRELRNGSAAAAAQAAAPTGTLA
jgi:long-chain acyl-CoA synthetase